jgi:AraC-like DNA-binding protein
MAALADAADRTHEVSSVVTTGTDCDAGAIYPGRACHRHDLLVTDQVSVSTIECGPEDGRWLFTQTWSRPSIVLIRTGRYGRRFRGRFSVLDATQGYVQQAGEEVLIQHLGSLGHRCTVLTVRPDILPTLVRVRIRVAPIEFRTTPATDLAHRVLLANCRRGTDAAAIAEDGIRLVAGLFAEWGGSPPPNRRLGTSAVTRRVVDLARELATTGLAPPSLASIAAVASVSPQYLTRVFRQSTGLTLGRYRNRVRVRLALERLADGEDDLRRIAHDLGFADQAHFSRTVLTEVGLQPSALRRLLS